ncbi:MAG TPA: S1 RNA-binding domain-containing protein [Pirellulaceae bacterium]|nr:S1 RNA-binding domain-containing protein [Pirellulaceae bacterium]
MPAETPSSVDPAQSPVNPTPTAERPPVLAAAPGAGPLARFTRTGESEGATPPAGEAKPVEQPAQARPAASPARPSSPGQPPAGYRPRGSGGRPKSQREKEREEDRQLDRELAGERGRGEERGGRAPVPVPNRRQRSEELEAEVEAALGGVSLESIVAADIKTDANRLENGTQHRAQVVDLHGDDVFFALGGKNQGITSVRNFAEAPKPGDMIDVTITGYNMEDNLYQVSVPGGAIVGGGWSDIAEGSLVDARITGANTGGLECEVGSIRGFIPVSQISLYRTENTADYVGQKLICVVTESNERRGNLVLSRRAVLEREKEESKKQLLADLQPGQMREGTVRKIHDFGAFVDLGGVDGLIHVSQLAWERVKHPSEVVQEGQKVRVRIERIDEETGKISLSLKNPEEHPWTNIEQRFPVGTTVKGPVSRIAQFGAFVKLAPGVEGLIHISELAHHKVFKVENVVKEGQEVECKVLDVDGEAQRMSLSLKAAIAKPEKTGDGAGDKAEAEEPPRPLAVPKRSGPLKGGVRGKAGSGGEQFGLKW